MYVSPEQIHRALSDQLENSLEADYNHYPYPEQHPAIPAISIWPGDADYIAYYGTMGPDGTADMMLRIRADVGAIDSENIAIQMWELHAVGELARSSIVDAVNADPTLGGLVQNAKVLTSAWPIDDSETSGVAWWPVVIIFKKDGAAA